MQFSPDGEWFWDGGQWRPAYSPDRRWRWDGARWVPAGPVAVQRWRYEPSQWTRRLQVIVLALTLIGGVIAIVLVPAFIVPTMQRTLDATLATMPPDPNVDPQSLRDTMNATIVTSLVFGVVLGAGVFAVIIAGVVRLWRWVYWYLVVAFLIAPLGVLENIATFSLGLSPVSVPGWVFLYSVPFALIETALGIWMIVLYRRYGTWARRRIPA